MDKFWEVVKSERVEDGVKPIMCNYEDLKKSESWMLFHVYNGRTIFETYARAALCWYEKHEGKTNCFN